MQHEAAGDQRSLLMQETVLDPKTVTVRSNTAGSLGGIARDVSKHSLASSLYSQSSTFTLEGSRKDLVFAFYNLNKEQRVWSRRCTALLVFTLLMAVGCVVLRVASFFYQRQPQAIESEVFVMNDFHSVGCFPLLGNDAPSDSQEFMVRDLDCMDPEKNGLRGQLRCRSGLPFYRFTTGGVIPWRWCAKLCLLKGLDISGVVDAKECRCGASEQNFQVWAKDVMPRKDLHFDPTSVVAFNASSCRVVAAQYLGPLPIETWRSNVLEADLTYIRSIVSSTLVSSLEQQPAEATPTAAAMTVTPTGVDFAEVARNSSCYPGPCASGWPWPIWTVYRSGIPFAYDATVDPSTMAVVQDAIRRIREVTCIKFTEVSLSFALTYKIVITKKHPGPCFSSPIGYPGFMFRDTEVNLASCGEHVGVIMHELGHALGMSHEQARQDRDLYISINWMHISQDYLEQYYASSTSYIGSKDVGFVPYDYGSVMHYSASVAMQSRPIENGKGRHDDSMGQRNSFSALDVLQLRDMYHCDVMGETCVDNDKAIRPIFQVGGRGASCQALKEYCQHDDYGETISYFCAKSCDRCPRYDRGLGGELDFEGHRAHIQRAACEDADETVCEMLDDYCPGKTSGLEQFMSLHCQKRCCLPQFCNSSSCDHGKEKVSSPPAVAAAHSSDSAAMDVTFDCSRYENQRLLKQRLQLRFSCMLGAGLTVKLLKAPSCLEGCHHGQARVEAPCCQDCLQTCGELRLKWVLLSPKQLSAFTGGDFLVVVQQKEVLDIPFLKSWQDFVAYATQYRWVKYVAAAVCALTVLFLVLLLALRYWWRRVRSNEGDEDEHVDVVLKEASGESSHLELSQHELSDWLRHTEAEPSLLPWNRCWRHRRLLLTVVGLVALVSAGFIIAVDLVAPAAVPLQAFAPASPSSVAPIFLDLGCFATDMPAGQEPVEMYDNNCLRTGQTCGGLPFYRLKLGDRRSCAEFCLSKGLDLSGILDGIECRCGATADHPIWEATRPRPDLHWTPGSPVELSSAQCRLEVMRPSGPAGDVFEAMRSNNLHEKDLLYVSGIVRGLVIVPPKPTPGLPVRHVGDKVIPFVFVEPLSNATKEAFREAMDLIVRSTCISFVESDGSNGTLGIRIHGTGHDCEASRVGWAQGVDLYLGWCSTSFHLGAILHELGHALGLINEEQRSDRGEFVKSKTPSVATPAPLYYDYGSVMHGIATSRPVLDSGVGVHDPQIGQRSGLSALDVLKLREIYGCGVPPDHIKVGICQQLMRHCRASGPLASWMSEHCQETCEPPMEGAVGFRFGFSMPGFDLEKFEDRVTIGHGFASAIQQALAASNATVEVLPGEAIVQVACGCQGARGRACRSCTTLEALLRRSSGETLQRWLRKSGFEQLEVQFFTVDGEDVRTLILEDSGMQLGYCFVGTLCATFALMQVLWLCWWTRTVKVEADPDLSEE